MPLNPKTSPFLDDAVGIEDHNASIQKFEYSDHLIPQHAGDGDFPYGGDPFTVIERNDFVPGVNSKITPGGIKVIASLNPLVDGLLGGYKFPLSIQYSFPDANSDYERGYSELSGGLSQISPRQMQAVSSILEGAGGGGFSGVMPFASVEAFTNLSLAYVGFDDSSVRVGQSASANPTAHAYYPAGAYKSGDVWFGTAYDYRNPTVGSYSYATHMHEIGHALGLKHGQELGGPANSAVPAAYDTLEYTVMTYRSYVGAPITGYKNETFGFPQTYMALDIQALQYMYGADFSVNATDTVYKWSPTNGETNINNISQGAVGSNRIFLTIWDGGGNDTYDFSAYTGSISINLNPGESSRVSENQLAVLDFASGKRAGGNVYNSFLYGNDERSLIENAIGGSGADLLVGNAVANRLNGNMGSDTIRGGGGNDILIGGAGDDILDGGSGRDVAQFNVARASASIVKIDGGVRIKTAEGTDLLQNIEVAQFTDGLTLLDGLIDTVSQSAEVYRFFNTTNSSHFYTSSGSERDSVRTSLPGLQYEGPAFKAVAEGEGELSVYRFLNTTNGSHFYTVDEAEKNSIQQNLPGYRYEGVAYSAFESDAGGHHPLFRFFRPDNGTHFYTASVQERDNVILNLPFYKYEGVAYNVDLF